MFFFRHSAIFLRRVSPFVALLSVACESGGSHPHGSTYGGASDLVETVKSSDGEPAILIECEGYLQCLQRSISACPGGYELLGSGSHKSVTPEQRAAYSWRVMAQAQNQCQMKTNVNVDQSIDQNARSSFFVRDMHQTSNVEVNSICVQAQLPTPPEGIEVHSLQIRCRPQEEAVSDIEPESAPPADLLGFLVRRLSEEFQSDCERRGVTPLVDNDLVSCPSTGLDVGAPGRVSIKYCNGQFCQGAGTLDISELSEIAVKQYRGVVLQLTEFLGLPNKRLDTFGLACRELSKLPACLRSGRGKAWTGWRWDDATQYYVKLIPPANDADTYKLRVGYEAGRLFHMNVPPVADGKPRPSHVDRQSTSTQNTHSACIPGQSLACSGAKGCSGYQVCTQDGTGLGACVCD